MLGAQRQRSRIETGVASGPTAVNSASFCRLFDICCPYVIDSSSIIAACNVMLVAKKT
jgi:hypothetical protein